MQPLMISPMINFVDIYVAMKDLMAANSKWAAAGAKSEEACDMILLETIRVSHPFPILERFLEKPLISDANVGCPYLQHAANEEQRILEGVIAKEKRSFLPNTQVFFEYDNCLTSEFDPERWRKYVSYGKNYVQTKIHECPFKGIPFGSGPRRCAGQNLARAIIRPTINFLLREFPVRNADLLVEVELSAKFVGTGRAGPGAGAGEIEKLNNLPMSSDSETDASRVGSRLGSPTKKAGMERDRSMTEQSERSGAATESTTTPSGVNDKAALKTHILKSGG